MKTFKQFLVENPRMLYNLPHEGIRGFRSTITPFIKKYHNKSLHIMNTNEGSIHNLDMKDSTMYYHMVNGSPREISVIKHGDNIQSYVDKGGPTGNSSYNKDMMKHHAKTKGYLVSDNRQTKGSKQLWMSLAKENSSNYKVYHHDNESLTHVDDEYLRKNEHKIWGDSENHEKNRLVLKYDE